jgi:hypothetical protein
MPAGLAIFSALQRSRQPIFSISAPFSALKRCVISYLRLNGAGFIMVQNIQKNIF